MSNTAQNLASTRIASLLDENSFVEIGGCVTARNTDFNLKQTATPSDGVITGYGVIDGNLVYVYSQAPSVKCMQRKSHVCTIWQSRWEHR